MNEFSTDGGQRQFSSAASLAALELYLQQLNLFAPVRRLVKIGQKTVKHSPLDKLDDAWIAILAGAHGLVEINSHQRSDPALQVAFGRWACAEPSVVQETLDACTTENVSELQQALDEIYRQHNQGYQHHDDQAWQILDADLTGMPCRAKATRATKGYFAKQRYRRGRQLGEAWLRATTRWSSINGTRAGPTCAPRSQSRCWLLNARCNWMKPNVAAPSCD